MNIFLIAKEKVKNLAIEDYLWWLLGLPFAIYILFRIGLIGVVGQVVYILLVIGIMLAAGYLIVRVPQWIRRKRN